MQMKANESMCTLMGQQIAVKETTPLLSLPMFALNDNTTLDFFIVPKLQFSQKNNHLLRPQTYLKLVQQFKSCWGVGQGDRKANSR